MKNPAAYIWAILASLTWGLTYALDQKILTSVSPLHLSIVNAVVTLIITIPLAFLTRQGSFTQVLHTKEFGLLIISSILVSLAGIFILYGIKQLGASSASIIEISYPAFVVLFSALLWHERFTPSFFIGGFLILCGTIVIIKSH